MPGERSLHDVLRNLLEYGDLSFRDFVELALYHPEFGYYAGPLSPVGKAADFVTSPALSPVFSFAVARLIHAVVGRAEGAMSSVVDVGCGDGALILSLYEATSPEIRERTRFFGVDRSLSRVPASATVEFATSIPKLDGPVLLLSNELFDAFPFARLVQREEHLHELWVTERDGELDWKEHEAAPLYDDYFAERGIELQDGQFADVSLEWEASYADLCRAVDRGLIVTFDYGYPAKQLFHPRARRFGTAAAYAGQRVSRDLLANPGEQDLTAHINFSDLERAGERHGFRTLFFDRQAKFLLTLGITDHELFRPVTELEVDSVTEGAQVLELRDDARRLILPDGIGHDIRVLVQEKGMGEGWSFQQTLF